MKHVFIATIIASGIKKSVAHSGDKCTLPALGNGLSAGSCDYTTNELAAGANCSIQVTAGYTADGGTLVYTCHTEAGQFDDEPNITVTGCDIGYYQSAGSSAADGVCSQCDTEGNATAANVFQNTTTTCTCGNSHRNDTTKPFTEDDCSVPPVCGNITEDGTGAHFNRKITYGDCPQSGGLSAGQTCTAEPEAGYAVDTASKTLSCDANTGEYTTPTVAVTGCLENYLQTAGTSATNGVCSACDDDTIDPPKNSDNNDRTGVGFTHEAKDFANFGTHLDDHSCDGQLCDIPTPSRNLNIGDCPNNNKLGINSNCTINVEAGYITSGSGQYVCDGSAQTTTSSDLTVIGCAANYHQSVPGDATTAFCSPCLNGGTLPAANFVGEITQCTCERRFKGANCGSVQIGDKIAEYAPDGATPFVSSITEGTTLDDISGMYNITFSQDIYKTNHASSGSAPAFTMTTNGEDRLAAIGLTSNDMQLCFEAGNVNVNCGRGFHCSNEADTNKADCIAKDETWEDDAAPHCYTYQQALTNAASNIGTNQDKTANEESWRKGVSVGLCVKTATLSQPQTDTVNGVPNVQIQTFAQVGADQTFYVEEDKCHMTNPKHGVVVNNAPAGQYCNSQLLSINASCQYTCQDGYALDRDTVCEGDKRLRAGTCTLIEGDGGKDQLRPDADDDTDNGPRASGETYEDYEDRNDSDHLEDMNKNTQYSSTGGAGSFDNTTSAHESIGTMNDIEGSNQIPGPVPVCRFLPPNRIFPDALIQGQEFNSDDDKSMGGENEDHSSSDNAFFADDTDTDYKNNIAQIRMRFNADALTTDAKNSYNYYLIFMTKGSISENMDDDNKTALSHDNQLGIMSIDASGEKGNNSQEFFQMDHEQVSANPNDCYYDDANDATIQHCRPTAQIEFWKRYQVVIGAASKCAGSIWWDKKHVFIRATYTVDSEFTLKYAPGLNLDNSGFKELQPGVWVRNRLSSKNPTLMMHSDYSKSIINLARASQTVTHASLHAFTRLELLDPVTGSDSVSGDSVNHTTHDATTNKDGNNGHSAHDSYGEGDTAVGSGMCRDAHVHSTKVSGFNNNTGDDSDSTEILNDARGCLFRARMVIQQFQDDINSNNVNFTETEGHYRDRSNPSSITYHESMVSTLSGYQLELAMSQYAQFNMRVLATGGIQGLADIAKRPPDFGLKTSVPSIADQNNPESAAFGQDVRFDICGCHIEHEHADAATPTVSANADLEDIKDNNNDVSPYGFKNRNQCSYNTALHDFLKDNRADARGLKDYSVGQDERVGFIVTKSTRAGDSSTHVPTTIADATTKKPNLNQGLTYVKQFDNDNDTEVHGRGIGAACTYEAFFPPQINTPFAYVRAWFMFKEATHVDQVEPGKVNQSTANDINTNPKQWAPGGEQNNDGTQTHSIVDTSTYGFSGHDDPGSNGEPNNGLNPNEDSANNFVHSDEARRRLRGEDIRRLAEDATQKAPPMVQHSVHFKFA